MKSIFDWHIVGYLLFKDFCENVSEEPVPQMSFYDEVCFTYLLIFPLLTCVG